MRDDGHCGDPGISELAEQFWTVWAHQYKADAINGKQPPVTCVLIDIGGVLLSDGWNHLTRRAVTDHFNLDYEEVDKRHQTNVATYEEGNLSIGEYLRRVVFFEERAFSPGEFQQYMFDQSEPYLEMIAFVKQLKAQYGLKIVVLSNEAREMNAHRIAKFGLNTFVDTFISSCLVHLRKPDEAIFRLAIDVVLTPLEQIVYIENTPLFVEIMGGMGVQSILHRDWESTAAELASMGLPAQGALQI